MKRLLTSCLILLSFFFTQCSEDELVSSTYLSSNLDVQTLSASNSKVPVLTNVAISGSKVTLSITNNAAPAEPDGGYELMLNGKRTKTEITDRVYSASKNVTMSFTVDDPASHTYQVYARWNTGYKSSNKISGANAGEATDAPSAPDESTETDPDEVKQPSNRKRPVISKATFNGSKVTLEFVNFVAPGKPEGGFELMLDGKRTYTDVTERVHSSSKVVKMTFNLGNPDKHYYQIYARWNTGYLSSEKFYPGQANQGDDDDDSEEEDDDNDDVPSSTLPNMKLVKAYEFEDNIGRNVNDRQDGLKVHHLGRNDGKVVSVDGVGAYRFRITPKGPKNSYRQELIPRSLPAPYFDGSNGFEAKWNKEYIYEIRMKISSDHDMGSGWTSYFSSKNDYTVSRLGSFTMYMFGDHYWARQYYAKNHTRNPNGEASVFTHFDANGKKLDPGVDFKETSGFGGGYPTYSQDQNKWVKWTYHIKWSYTESGFARIYKNGKLFYSYNGPTGFKDDQAPYIKFGLYNSTWKQGESTGSSVQESYVDYLRVYVPNNW